jgi:hypothetical protein
MDSRLRGNDEKAGLGALNPRLSTLDLLIALLAPAHAVIMRRTPLFHIP